jgi:hypothetical protein
MRIKFPAVISEIAAASEIQNFVTFKIVDARQAIAIGTLGRAVSLAPIPYPGMALTPAPAAFRLVG